MASALSEQIDAITAAALGALQGLTEFLPVSSSGHIAIGAAYFGIKDASLALTVLLHLGTFLATVLLFRHDLAKLMRAAVESLRSPSRLASTSEGRTLVAIAVATLVTAMLGWALHDLAEQFTRDLHLVGWGFLVSGLFVSASVMARGSADSVSLRQAVVVGLMQGLAVLPGISRSGATIATAMLMGVSGSEAFRFSFLASLPAIVGAAVYEIGRSDGILVLGVEAWVGGATALVTGYIALVILRHVILVGRMWIFALYLFPLAAFLITR